MPNEEGKKFYDIESGDLSLTTKTLRRERIRHQGGSTKPGNRLLRFVNVGRILRSIYGRCFYIINKFRNEKNFKIIQGQNLGSGKELLLAGLHVTHKYQAWGKVADNDYYLSNFCNRGPGRNLL